MFENKYSYPAYMCTLLSSSSTLIQPIAFQVMHYYFHWSLVRKSFIQAFFSSFLLVLPPPFPSEERLHECGTRFFTTIFFNPPNEKKIFHHYSPPNKSCQKKKKKKKKG